MRRWRTRSCAVLAGVAAAFALAACGSQQQQDAQEPSGIFPVQITTAAFPTSQRLSQHTHLVISVRNTGTKAIPDVAVTITTPPYGTAVEAFDQYVNNPDLANHSRPVWVVTTPPSPPGQCYSCAVNGPYGGGGYGGAVTAYANTWAMGRLKPGQTATFDWAVVAVSPGTHPIRYEVAAGLNGKAKARLSGGGIPTGIFRVNITSKPVQSYVNNNGQIVTTTTPAPTSH